MQADLVEQTVELLLEEIDSDVLAIGGSKPNPSKFPANLDSLRHSRARR
jgi:hypothetical protein